MGLPRDRRAADRVYAAIPLRVSLYFTRKVVILKLNIRPLPVNFLTMYALGKPSELDLFDVKGWLLLELGQIVTYDIIKLACRGEVYVLTYQWIKKNRRGIPSSTEHQHHVNSLKRVYYEANMMRQDYLDTATTIVAGLIRKSKEKPGLPVDFRELESYDYDTYVHSVNVALLATIIGLQMDYKPNMLNSLALGALLHDWGKLIIPSELLNKPAGLTAEEFNIIKQHPGCGEQRLRDVIFSEDVLKIIRQHHERWNGQGYPDSLSGEAISRSAQIVAVADVFDALTADRPYRAGLPPYHALEMILSGVNKNFSPDVVKAFRSSLVLYPENSLIILNTGETGTVIAIPLDLPTRPVVRIISDRKGQPVKKEKIVNLLMDLSLWIGAVDFSAATLAKIKK